MRTVRSGPQLREALTATRKAGGTVGLVPTMGALHEGHLSLIRAAVAECDTVVVSVFVNPKQFGPGEDFEAYPRDEARDGGMVENAGADLLYLPDPERMYPEGFATTVAVSGMTDVLCGAPASRGSGHFSGVTTVVCKLLCATAPDRAYFGQKDAQQLAVIRRMVRDLELPVEVRGVATVREPDGLAMSSRNAYLGPDERDRATALSRALDRIEDAIQAGDSVEAALRSAHAVLSEAQIEPEYLEARDPETLESVAELDGSPVLFAVAAKVGRARLIDNKVIGAARPGPVA